MKYLRVLILASTVLGGQLVSAETKAEGPNSSTFRVVPAPTDYKTGHDLLCLHPGFATHFDQSLQHDHLPKDLVTAVMDVESRIWSSKHRYLSIDAGAEHFGSSGCEHHLKSLVITIEGQHEAESVDGAKHKIASIMDSAIRPAEDRPDLERYTLSVPLEGHAMITAPTALGAFRGLTTFENLFYYLPSQSRHHGHVGDLMNEAMGSQLALGSQWTPTTEELDAMRGRRRGTWYAPSAPYEIEDKPAFGWRAVMLDTSRNWFSKASILKLNVFHWHITDSNSWPLDLSSHPELARKGAYGLDQKYTDEDIKHIIRYAGERGIDTVLEIDTPGHTASIAESHPEFVACFERDPWQTYSGQPPAGQLRFASQPAVDFTNEIFGSTLDLVAGQYFGTGGDEVNEACMLEDEETAAALREHGWSLDDAINDYTGKTHATILARDKIPVVWQEMVLDHGDLANLSRKAIVDIWINSQDARKVLDKGFKIIHAASDYFYLGHGMGEWVARPEGKTKEHNFGNPFKSWQRMYSFDPFDNVDESQRGQVLGGQASLWAEQTDETNFESVMWPRAAAVAELFWTGSAGQQGYPRDTVDALPRMHDIRYRLVDRGVRAGPLQPHWCALRPGVCIDDL